MQNKRTFMVRLSINMLLNLLSVQFLFLLAGAAFLFDLSEEVVTLIIDEDKCREVLNFNFPDSFHAEFGIFHALDALDVVLCKDSCRSADAAEIEAAVLFTSVGHLLAAVTFREHNHASAVALEEINIGIHTSGSSRAH